MRATCRKGHPQTGHNVEHRSDGKTRCRVCDRERRRMLYGTRTDIGRRYERLSSAVTVAIRALESGNARLAMTVLRDAPLKSERAA